MTKYNPLIRPVANDSDILDVFIGLALSQLVDIDEKNQIMVTSIWLKQQWTDYRLVWKPEDYGGITYIHFPIQRLWAPDLVLYNTAEGAYAVEVMNSATIFYDGSVTWKPPAIFRSSCSIDIEYFPFDEQRCIMKFGSWTYAGDVVDLIALNSNVERENYRANGEWEIVDAPAVRSALKYPCCVEIYIDVTYTLVLHRNPLFYIITLVIPCVLISLMTALVFYLPSDAQEKITLSISVLLALIVFLLLIPNLIPPTSKTIPLIGRYMLFTMAMVSLSILATVVTINVHFRSITTHEMPPWMKTWFLNYLPRAFCMERPDGLKARKEKKMKKKLQKEAIRKYNNPYMYSPSSSSGVWEERSGNYSQNGNYRMYNGRPYNKLELRTITPSLREEIEGREVEHNTMRRFRADSDDSDEGSSRTREREWKALLASLQYIKDNINYEDDVDQSEEDWKFVALVIDRILLWVFLLVAVVGTIAVFIEAPIFWEKSDAHPILVHEEPVLISRLTNDQIQGSA
ncbi:neuronal acetylcholine receptor subunit beta-3-like [Strongylocentrotus purpuratus]|nr:neuronal acetylcholine receptor subunit beta-3-like [Strongylocentrotus purpuratus]XP_030847978.1 neuronal acetylcholine receptor subunit beta-3-like [Strongylocentrotus purpuratus]